MDEREHMAWDLFKVAHGNPQNGDAAIAKWAFNTADAFISERYTQRIAAEAACVPDTDAAMREREWLLAMFARSFSPDQFGRIEAIIRNRGPIRDEEYERLVDDYIRSCAPAEIEDKTWLPSPKKK